MPKAIYYFCLLAVLLAPLPVYGQTTELPVKVEASVEIPNQKPTIDALTARVLKLESRAAALEKRVADLEAKLARASAKVTLQFLEPSGKPTPGITVKQYVADKEIETFTPDKLGNVLLEFKLQ